MRNRSLFFWVVLTLSLSACNSGNQTLTSQPPQPGGQPPEPIPTPSATGPDLRVDAAAVPSSIEFTQQDFSESDCEIQEGCVLAPGTRRLMLFEGDIINAGAGDLVLGNPESSSYFSWSPCHGHYHLKDIMLYELVDGSGHVVTSQASSGLSVVARKQGFCIEDVQPAFSGISSDSGKYDCTNQGLTAGWEDIYDNQLPCQWLDITGIAPGKYFLRITVNPDHLYPSVHPNDNVAMIPVTIPD